MFQYCAEYITKVIYSVALIPVADWL